MNQSADVHVVDDSAAGSGDQEASSAAQAVDLFRDGHADIHHVGRERSLFAIQSFTIVGCALIFSAVLAVASRYASRRRQHAEDNNDHCDALPLVQMDAAMISVSN